jgi:AbrB family looped-hinge helix DNA binding protein
MALRISEKGWVVIPSKLRKKYQLTPGSEVIIVDYGGVLSIVPAMKNPVQQGRGLLKGIPSLAKDLRKEHAKEKARGSSKTK